MKIHSSEFKLDYIPIVSTAASLIELFLKSVYIPFTTTICARFTYLEEKNTLRCLLALLPIIGNVTIFVYDYCEKIEKSLMEKCPIEETAEPDNLHEVM